MKTRTIKVDYLARVEGEGSLHVKISGGRATDVKLKIFEPPRFFEAFLRGRPHTDAPDITARICGICPVAYQMSSVHAMEDALGIRVEGALRELRRLLYCGEWIESHTLHIYMLHAPDFLGYPDAIRMAKDHPSIVQRGLRIKKAGNHIVNVVGGREIHPVNVRVGGFYRAPRKSELLELAEVLKPARDEAIETVRWASKLPIPEFDVDYEFVALRHDGEYPFNEGRIVSSAGLDIPARSFDQHFVEEHVAHSNALHCLLKERGAYFVGPLARFNLNVKLLSPLAAQCALEAGLSTPSRNPFQSIVVRAVEVVYALDEALRVIAAYQEPEQSFVDAPLRAGVGFSCTEAPRGILYHRYEIDASGTILDARIVPPTSQNQKTIENDLSAFVDKNVKLSDANLTARCEQLIRNYDPCISCATHFLKLHIDRGTADGNPEVVSL